MFNYLISKNQAPILTLIDFTEIINALIVRIKGADAIII